MNIGVDIDGVLARFEAGFNKIINDLYPGRIPLDYVPTKWNWYETGVMSKEEYDHAWRVLNQTENFWLKLPPYVEAVEALCNFLSDHRDVSVFYITSRAVSAGLPVLCQTQNWLAAYHLMRSNTSVLPVSSSRHKRALVEALDICAHVDDYLPTITSLGYKGWLLDQPWNSENRDYEAVAGEQIVKSLKEFLDAMVVRHDWQLAERKEKS